MKRYFLMLVGLLVAVAPVLAQASNEGGSIRVQVHYTGKGEVSQNHKIFVALWDSPQFAEANANVTPQAVKWVGSKNGMVTFSDVRKLPAYVSCAYDPAGKWDGKSGPPDDASLGLYGNAAMQPQAIHVASGQTTAVNINFDDSIKMK